LRGAGLFAVPGLVSGCLLVKVQKTQPRVLIQIRQIIMNMPAQCAVDQPVAVLNIEGQAIDQLLLLIAWGNEIKAILIFCMQHDKLQREGSPFLEEPHNAGEV